MKRQNGIAEGFKHCPRCDRVLSESAFSKNKAHFDGLQSQCKECKRIMKFLYRRLRESDTVRYRKRYPKKASAQNIAQASISLGSCCELCGSTEGLQRHHLDYLCPRFVVILCRKCHSMIHRHFKELEEKQA